MPSPAVAEVLRPIRIFRLSPTPSNVIPQIPEALTDLLLRELSSDPHGNPLQCTSCEKVFIATQSNGRRCTERKGGISCEGTIQPCWDRASIARFLTQRIHAGGVAIARTLDEDFTPVGLAICEVHTPNTVIGAVNMPMGALSGIYSSLGHDGPYLIVTHLAIEHEGRDLQQVLIDLMMKSIESAVRAHKLDVRSALVLLDDRSNELRHRFVRSALGKDYRVIASDTLGGRHRALVPVHFKINED